MTAPNPGAAPAAGLKQPAPVEAVGASSTTGAGLYPTKTRVRLTAAIDRGDVHYYPRLDGSRGDTHWNATGGGRLINDRIAELEAAGWVRLGPELDGGVARRWVLTEYAPAVTP